MIWRVFFINSQNQKEMDAEFVSSFFIPKLTNEELKLVQEGNDEHLKTYSRHYPDVDDEEMNISNSKSKYVHVYCERMTKHLKIGANDAEINEPIY